MADLSIKGKRPDLLYYSFLCLSSPGGNLHPLSRAGDRTERLQSLPPCRLVWFCPLTELSNVALPKMFSTAY